MSWITENWGLKLLSFTVAVMLWLATVGEPEAATAISVPVQYRNVPQNLEISSEMPESAYIEVRGPSGKLSATSMANVVVVIDLAGQTKPGERTHSILDSNVKLPSGVQFLRAVPAQIKLRMEYQVSREVPVTVRYAPNTATGYRISSQHVSPEVVRIVGPESQVSGIDRVQTDPIELTSGEDQTFHAHVFTGNPLVRLAKSDLVITVNVALSKVR